MRNFMIREWGLAQNVFVSSPPESRVLKKVFTGREDELEAAAMAVLDAPRRLLVQGLFGVGKTVFIQELRRQLTAEVPVVFVNECLSSTDRELPFVILRGLATELAASNSLASEIYRRFLGSRSRRKLSERSQDGLQGGLPGFVQGASRDDVAFEEESTFDDLPLDPIPAIRELTKHAEEVLSIDRVIIAIDEMDKRDPNTVRRMLTGARDILHTPICSFLFTGHPIGVMRDAYSSAGGIVDQDLVIPTMNKDVMATMIERYLHAGRKRGWQGGQPMSPLTEESVTFIISKSFGIPRICNIICYNVLQEAAHRRMKEVGLSELETCWDARSHQLRKGIRPELRNMLEIIAQTGEPIDVTNVPDDFYHGLNIETRSELVRQLDYALKHDLLVTADGRELWLNRMLMEFQGIMVVDDEGWDPPPRSIA